MEKKTAVMVIIAVVVIAVVGFFFLLVGGVVLWQLGTFTAGDSGTNRAMGFTQVTAFDRSIQYKDDGTLSFVAINAVGTSIENISFSFTGDCAGQTHYISELKALETSTVSVDCNPKNPWESFSTDVTITHYERVAGTVLQRNSTGRITGTVGY
ncbi:MAG: hypothetical protein JW778_01590 [Candidatus Altiarchaeota archaeon]|nr:hypothetical protein [Candidatus Altiarchaeota archaeon]